MYIMQRTDINAIAKQSLDLVNNYFSELSPDDRAMLPPIFSTEAVWFCLFNEYSIGIFYLTSEEKERVDNNLKNQIQAFPGFYINEQNRKEGTRVAIKQEGSCNYYSSNYTSNIIAFSICPGSSFIVIDHFHEIIDSTENKHQFKVDLAYFLGLLPNEKLQDIENRLTDLLNHSLSIWRSMR